MAIFALSYDEEEDKDVIEILNTVKKSRRSMLARELIRLGWKMKQAETEAGAEVMIIQNKSTSPEPHQKKPTKLSQFEDE